MSTWSAPGGDDSTYAAPVITTSPATETRSGQLVFPVADSVKSVNSAAGLQTAPVIDLRLIATSDLHACLLPYDYCANRAVAGRSLSEISRQIARARTECANSLLFDNGDFLQGNPLADYVASAPRRKRAHPVITAFNTLGYDAATLGNHEFNYGVPFLSATLKDARFPVVSANIATRLGTSPSRDQTFVPPFALLKRRFADRDGRFHTLRIGVIGFAPPQIELWDRDQVAGRIRMRDIVASAQAWLPRLKARGADVIVVLAHSGIGAMTPQDGMENAATALAALPEVDAVIAGHSHLAFPGPGIEPAPGIDPVQGLLAGKPAVMPGHSGSHLGLIDLVLTRTSHGPRRWHVSASTARLRWRSEPAKATEVALRKAIGPDHRATLAWSRRVLGESRVDLHTHFATSAPSAALDLISAAKADYASRAIAGTCWAKHRLLASAAPFRSGGRSGPDNFTDIPAGLLRMRNMSDLYVFPNTLVALAVTGAEICNWLEQSAALFHQIAPGASDAILHDVTVPSFTFEVLPGLSYAIDLSQPARFDHHGQLVNPSARRIVGVRLDDQPLDPDETFVLVTNNHRASLAMTNASGLKPQVVLSNGVRTQQVLADYIRSVGTVGAPPRRSWHFLPLPGTSVKITAGRASQAHLDDLASFRPEHLGTDSNGFEHYRLYL
ncbi:MAG: bifunctional 2',3'-cyclic-nucleotide 2'-phosphodiesterase/3'-nucleotidase [Tabrizicola sp.]|nr:bifunctional 2',3'-cyclic-nucleotide 2'-phosphodiesterase/3'-nucleotidase [Tabrizicola sp.]